VDFTFTDEQRMMAASVRALLEDVCAPATLRSVAEHRDQAGAARWARYCELGLPGLLAPESAGGLGLADTDFVLIAEEAGRAADPEALVEHAGVAVPLLAEFAHEARAAAVLAAAATGEARLAVAHPGNPFVPAADAADWLLVVVGGELHLAPRSAATLIAQPANDALRPLHRVEFTPAAAAATLLATGATASDALARAFERGALLAAAQSLGLAERMLEIGVGYASERRQFGQAIGAYQGLKHPFASAQVKLEFARPVVYAAGGAAGAGVPNLPIRLDERTSVAVSHAKLSAVAAADACARIAMQAHGAMGYSWEVDLHFYMKRAWALAGAWGDGNFHARRVQAALWSGRQPLGPGHTFAGAEG
jgi:alkylation response protein AidB-like acyl-CoA dehydrogenase